MYKYLDHTSDIGILVKSKNLKELFEEAVFAMFSIIGERKETKTEEPRTSRSIEVKDDSFEKLLVRFLNEFLYLFYAKNFLPVKISIPKTGKFFVEARASFVRVNEKNFTFLREIKAATYHGASVTGNGAPSGRFLTGRHPLSAEKSFKAKILFDV